MRIFLLFAVCFLPRLLCGSSWLIVADGDPLPVEELKDRMQDRKVLVLDGAVNRFTSLPFYPDCLLGDFDSIEDPSYWGVTAVFSGINELSLSYRGNFGITIVPAKDQNYTDLEKGIAYCDKEGATSILIVQATGKRLDHTLGNLGLLKKYYRLNRDLIIETEKEQIIYLKNNEVHVEGGVGQYCAIMGYPEALMTTSGLAYNGDQYFLQQGVQESICNSIADFQSTISIQGEALIILPKSSVFKIGTK